MRLSQAGTALRPKAPASASAAPSASSSGIPSGSAPRVSTGLPNVITESIPAPRR